MLIRLMAVACLYAAVLAACGSPATTNTTRTAETTPPTTVATTAPTPTTVLPTAALAPTARPTSAAQTEKSAPVTLVLDSSATQARYHAHEQLVGRNLPSEAVGTSSAVKGSIMIAPDGSIVSDQSQVTVDLSQLKSDESRRDNFIKGNTLETSRFPMATFVPRSASDLPTPLPTSGQASFTVAGDLTVHGVTRPVTWQIIAQFSDNQVIGNATTQVNISDFGMTPPKAGPVLSIQDGLTLELAFQAARQA